MLGPKEEFLDLIKTIEDLYDTESFSQILEFVRQKVDRITVLDRIKNFEIGHIFQRIIEGTSFSIQVQPEGAKIFKRKVFALSKIAVAFYTCKNYAESLECLKLALELMEEAKGILGSEAFKQNFGFSDTLLPSLIYTLGGCHHNLKQYTKAQKRLKELPKDFQSIDNCDVALAESYYDESSLNFKKWRNGFKISLISVTLLLVFNPSLWNWILNEAVIIPLGQFFGGGFILYKGSKYLISLNLSVEEKVGHCFKHIKRGIKDFYFGSWGRYKFYEDVIEGIKYKEDKYTDFLNICKMYYFNEDYDNANLYAQKALIMLQEEQQKQKELDSKIIPDFSVFIYDWLSRIAYKTKNHVTATEFYQNAIKCLVEDSSDFDLGENSFLPKPELNDMVKYLQENREILKKSEQKGIVVPLVWSLIAAFIFEGLQIYSSIGNHENNNTAILYARSKYCVQKIFTAGHYSKKEIDDILVNLETNREVEKQRQEKEQGDLTVKATQQAFEAISTPEKLISQSKKDLIVKTNYQHPKP